MNSPPQQHQIISTGVPVQTWLLGVAPTHQQEQISFGFVVCWWGWGLCQLPEVHASRPALPLPYRAVTRSVLSCAPTPPTPGREGLQLLGAYLTVNFQFPVTLLRRLETQSGSFCLFESV